MWCNCRAVGTTTGISAMCSLYGVPPLEKCSLYWNSSFNSLKYASQNGSPVVYRGRRCRMRRADPVGCQSSNFYYFQFFQHFGHVQSVRCAITGECSLYWTSSFSFIEVRARFAVRKALCIAERVPFRLQHTAIKGPFRPYSTASISIFFSM